MALEQVDITVTEPAGGTSAMRGHLALPPGPGPHPGVVVLHELFGVNEDLQRVAADLAATGYLVLAIELYHRSAPAGLALPRDDAGRAQGFAYLNEVTRDGAVADAAAAVAYLAGRSDCTGQVGLLGFSAGGHAAFLAATRLPVPATAVLYGGWLTTTDVPLSRPEPTITLSPGIRGQVLYVVGDADAIISPAQRAEIEDGLTAAGVPHEVVSLPGAAHAFFWPGTPSYDAAATREAWELVQKFFGELLA